MFFYGSGQTRTFLKEQLFVRLITGPFLQPSGYMLNFIVANVKLRSNLQKRLLNKAERAKLLR
jgi:hypothetical protein